MNYHHRLKNLGRGRDHVQGRIQDFKLGGALKKAKILGIFRVKNHDITPKNHIFFQFWGGEGPRWVRPPLMCYLYLKLTGS
jgi:hypothetical protein